MITFVCRGSTPRQQCATAALWCEKCGSAPNGLASLLVAVLVAAGSLFSLVGCVTEFEPGQEPLAPKPREVPSQPSWATADVVQIFPVLYAKDTNADGWGDVIQVMMYLWTGHSDFKYPIYDDRAITFEIYRPGQVARGNAAPIASWSFTPQQMNASRTKTVVGNAYYLELPIPPAAYMTSDDQPAPGIADLIAILAPDSDGPEATPIRSGVSTIRLRSGAR